MHKKAAWQQNNNKGTENMRDALMCLSSQLDYEYVSKYEIQIITIFSWKKFFSYCK